MNKGMIMLGLILIAGLSFAWAPGPWQYQWQNYTSWRYFCNLAVIGGGQYSAAYAYMQPYASPTDLNYMNYYLGIMYGELLINEDDYGMVWEYYATPFRADMAGYNSGNALFRSIFNAAYREYVAATGDPGGAVRDYLAASRAAYMSCAGIPPWGIV